VLGNHGVRRIFLERIEKEVGRKPRGGALKGRSIDLSLAYSKVREKEIRDASLGRGGSVEIDQGRRTNLVWD